MVRQVLVRLNFVESVENKASTLLVVKIVSISMKMTFNEQAWSEVEENKQIKSIWAKAFTQSEGNSEKTKAIYMKLRVDSLKKEAEEKIHLAQKEFKQQASQQESTNDKVQRKLQNFLKSNAVYISKKISDFEYMVSHQNTPIDSTIKYINEEWRIV